MIHFDPKDLHLSPCVFHMHMKMNMQIKRKACCIIEKTLLQLYSWEVSFCTGSLAEDTAFGELVIWGKPCQMH